MKKRLFAAILSALFAASSLSHTFVSSANENQADNTNEALTEITAEVQEEAESSDEAVLSADNSKYKIESKYKNDKPTWTYNFQTKTKNWLDAGAGTVKIYIKYLEPDAGKGRKYSEKTIDMKTSRNSLESASAKNLSIAPWMITEIGIRNDNKNDYAMDYTAMSYTYNFPASGSSSSLLYDFMYPNKGDWIGRDSSSIFHNWQPARDGVERHDLRRHIDASGFYKKFNDSLTLDPTKNESGLVTVLWDGFVTDVNDWYDNIMEKSGGYHALEMNDKPTMSLTVKEGIGLSNGAVTKGTTVDQLVNYGALMKYTYKNADGGEYIIGYDIDKAKMLQYMNQNSINKIDLVMKMDFPHQSIDWNECNRATNAALKTSSKQYFADDGSISATYQISRLASTPNEKTINLKNDYYIARQDNFYYNIVNANIVTVNLPIHYKNNASNHAHLSYNDVSDFLLIADDIKLQIGDDTKNLISPDTSYRSIKKELREYDSNKKQWVAASEKYNFYGTYGNVEMRFILPEGLDSGDAGITLILKGASIVREGLENDTNKDYFNVGTKYHIWDDYIAAGDPQRVVGEFKYYFSKNKVDTTFPTVEFEVIEAGETERSENGWQKQYEISMDFSENLFIGNNYNMDGTTRAANQVQYSLVDKETGVAYKISPGSGSTAASSYRTIQQTSAVDSSSSVIFLHLQDADGTRAEVDGILRLVGQDEAKNPITAELGNIKIDNLAPREALTVTEIGNKEIIGTQIGKQFTFDIEDASETGRVYYMFTENIDGAFIFPTYYDDTEEHTSGTIDTTLDKWAFIPQDNSTATDGSASIVLDVGETFNGCLYYFTMDMFGNMSDVKQQRINLNNADTTYQLFIDNDTSVPLSNYDITITTSAANKVYYRWMYPENDEGKSGYISAYKRYREDGDIGSGIQYTDSNEEVILDGECTLQIKIVSGTEFDEYTHIIAFDNSDPKLDFSSLGMGSTVRESQTVAVSASDPSGLVAAYAQLLDSDKNPIDGKAFNLVISDGMVNENINLSGLPTGVYFVEAIVRDKNDHEIRAISSPVFIRSTEGENGGIPTLEMEIPSDFEEDVPLVTQKQYTLNLDVVEQFPGAGYITSAQHLFYRIADSDLVFSAWVDAGAMTNTGEAFELSTTLTEPVVITPGKNTVTIQTVIGAKDANPDYLKLVADASVELYYDAEAPTVVLDLEDAYTTEDIYGTISVSDDSIYEITVESSTAEVVIEQAYATYIYTDGTEVTEAVPDTYTVTVNDNTEATITVTDLVGHVTNVPLVITKIDREGPAVSLDNITENAVGGRTDISAILTLYDVAKDSVKVALIPEDEKDSALDEDGDFKDEYYAYTKDLHFSLEMKSEIPDTYNKLDYTSEYTIKLAGVTGDYVIGVNAVDHLGNATITVLDDVLSPVDAEPEILEAAASPKLAGAKTVVTLTMDIPVSLLAQEFITDEDSVEEYEDDDGKTQSEVIPAEEVNLSNAKLKAAERTTTPKFIADEHKEYDLYVVDDLGRAYHLTYEVDEDMVTFGNTSELDIQLYKEVIFYNYETDEYEEPVITVIEDGKLTTAGDIWGYKYDADGEETGSYSGKSYIEVSPAEGGAYLYPAMDENGIVLELDGFRFDPEKSAEYFVSYAEIMAELYGEAAEEAPETEPEEMAEEAEENDAEEAEETAEESEQSEKVTEDETVEAQEEEDSEITKLPVTLASLSPTAEDIAALTTADETAEEATEETTEEATEETTEEVTEETTEEVTEETTEEVTEETTEEVTEETTEEVTEETTEEVTEETTEEVTEETTEEVTEETTEEVTEETTEEVTEEATEETTEEVTEETTEEVTEEVTEETTEEATEEETEETTEADLSADYPTVEFSVHPRDAGTVTAMIGDVEYISGGTVEPGTEITFTVIPADIPEYKFVKWDLYINNEDVALEGETDLTYTYIVDEPLTDDYTWYEIQAYFDTYYTLNVTASPEDCGTVEGGGEFKSRENAPINAIPNPGYKFTGWYNKATGEQYSQYPDINVWMDRNFELEARFEPVTIDGYYTKLVYSVEDIYETRYDPVYGYEINHRVYKDERVITVMTATAEGLTSPELWSESTAIVNGIDSSPAQATVTMDPYPGEPYSDELIYTPGNVTVTSIVEDPQSGLERIELQSTYESEDGETWYSRFAMVELYDEDGNFIDYSAEPLVIENELFRFEYSGDSDPYSPKRITVVFYENQYANMVAINGAGGTGHIAYDDGLMIRHIQKDELSEEDYALVYYYIDANGERVDVEDPTAEDVFYKKLTAEIIVSDTGAERGIFITNNSGSFTRELTYFDPSYTFSIEDKYGYTAEVSASIFNFDILPGVIAYELENQGKTNEPVRITISVYDEQSGVGYVTLTRGTEVIELTEDADNPGVFTGEIENSGSHVITFSDKVGNIAEKSFIVTDVDANIPELINVTLSNEERTAKSVTALLSYSKPGVTLTKVETAGILQADDISVNYMGNQITFFESGSVSVWFMDAYGNEGQDVVTVTNIYTQPPAVKAVAVLADNESSVEVHFEPATDDNGVLIDGVRDITELSVICNGVVRPVYDAEADAYGTYTIGENGLYSFTVYDKEGLSCYITLEIEDIDKTAPTITLIKWSYGYEVLEDGEWVAKTESGEFAPGDEAGYRFATDVYNVTKQGVTITAVTDSETAIMGKETAREDYTTEHSLEYDANGLYIFNLEKANGLSDSYGVEVNLIDKEAPVIEFALPGEEFTGTENSTISHEIVFYENEAANTIPYSKDLISKAGEAFRAYDLFGGYTDISDRVTIDYGEFNPDDLYANKFDRTAPYTVTYRVADDANNVTEMRLTVRLVGLYDTIVLVNGRLPDAANRIITTDESFDIELRNFTGIAYAKIEKGVYTMGEMKTNGTVMQPYATGTYQFNSEGPGWYTVFVQTSMRDYFNIQIYIQE